MTAEYSQISIMYIQLPKPANEKKISDSWTFQYGVCVYKYHI